ncbi:MAG: glycosyltransferase [Candidatus Omnitrophica bacterium]|nr:glycosyltransferase [Candidatus Omnitrophota bacterium]MDD5552520.1 glycosyltransferase [Candidatus Omnitrophota bacterium]
MNSKKKNREPEGVKQHFNRIAAEYDYWKKKNDYYYSLIKDFYRKNIPPGSSVLELGCATGQILASVEPKRGVGIDISDSLITLAKSKYPQYEFNVADVEEFTFSEKFDYCVMSDLIDHLHNIPRAIQSAYGALKPGGKLIITSINPLWNPLFGLLEKMRLKMPEGPHCFIPNRFLEFFCQMKGFKTVCKGALIFIPKKIIFIGGILNRIIPKTPLLNRFCWVQTLIVSKDQKAKLDLSCSVIVAAYNEEENIAECVERVPDIGREYEIIVINDGSKDKTPEILTALARKKHNLRVINFPENRGKASAIEEGIRAARKEVIIILDADMSVAPEDIPLFVEPLERGIADFINGTRLIYDMQKHAMAQVKRIANFILAVLFSALNQLRLTDTLCGTKAFFRKDFQDIKIRGEKWGDLVLLEHAKRKGLRIREIPIRYYTRTGGVSKMRFSDGLRFIRFTLSAALKR